MIPVQLDVPGFLLVLNGIYTVCLVIFGSIEIPGLSYT